MNEILKKYQPVIGLEVHTQLLTQTKAFSGDLNLYGEAPNTLVSAITAGHPGTLPKLNKKVVELSVMVGLATNCNINKYNKFARKNYFYADLPKGYQISQFDTPICTGGKVKIKTENGDKWIGITRIHMEEDAGKSIHDLDPFYTLIDLNRAGVPLVEIVSEPDMRSSDEAYQFLSEIRKLVRYLDICDGNMEEGSLRCDANVSIMPIGSETFGTKVELKNMNSIRNVKRAIEYEIQRQAEILDRGGKVDNDSRTFDADKGITLSMRSKEDAHDYRYFTEPDLPPLVILDEYIEKVKAKMPLLPEAMFNKLREEFALSDYDAAVISEDKETAEDFLEMVKAGVKAKSAANWVMGPNKSFMNENAVSIREFREKIPVSIQTELAKMTDEGLLSFSGSSQTVFFEIIHTGNQNPREIAETKNLLIKSDTNWLEELAEQAIQKHPAKVTEYKNGKTGLLGLFMGEIMKLSGGKADPKLSTEILKNKLDN